MKTTTDLRERLEKAAAQSGRSLTHEVEHRIERSFFQDKIDEYRELSDGDEPTKQLGDSLKLALGMLNKYTGRNWQSDPAARAASVSLISELVACALSRRDLPAPTGGGNGEAIDPDLIGYMAKMCFGLVSQDPGVLKMHEMAKALHEPEEADK
ncbi:hypothetical protein [Methylobacterium flocculans]|uniref:hypothetical protein n=1 Tax=Methylobacterium flocculans TaxID=2984843 RepID=UPI0021F39E94|nr:hypothetical protein [Methylobacterium sp. FF17]